MNNKDVTKLFISEEDLNKQKIRSKFNNDYDFREYYCTTDEYKKEINKLEKFFRKYVYSSLIIEGWSKCSSYKIFIESLKDVKINRFGNVVLYFNISNKESSYSIHIVNVDVCSYNPIDEDDEVILKFYNNDEKIRIMSKS